MINRRGVALIMTLWVMILLSSIAFQFIYSVRTEINATRNLKEMVKDYYLAYAGVNLGISELINRWDFNYIDEYGNMVFRNRGILLEEDKEPPKRDNIPLESGLISYEIEDEESKININFAPREVIWNLLRELDVEIEKRDIIADSILDWIDKNHEHRINGAEDDYYESLTNPYEAKDAPFDSINELLLVRGITKEIFDKLKKYVTVVGSNININTSSEIVLKSVLGENVAREVIYYRKKNGYFISPNYGGIVKSHYFTIKSRGKLPNSSIFRGIRVIVRKNGNSINIVYWNDNFI
jgi:general secretion pathway protein K